MEIGRWLYVVVNCVIVCCIVGKPFSLNTLIEAESQEKQVVHTTVSPKLGALEESEPAAERFSLNKGLKPLSRISKKFKETGTTLNLIPLGKKISPFKYRKTFQIKSPLKPKRVKHSLRTRHKRKNQAVISEVDGNAILNQKYIPLLKNLGMLFDNILGSDSGESFEITNNKRKRFKYFPREIDNVTCKCPIQRESNADSKSEEKTITSSETLASEISVTTEAATQTADNIAAGNLGSFRQNKNLPPLLPRNTFSGRRNNPRLGERSSTTYNGSAERYISGDHGDSEYNPERGQGQSGTESDEEHTNSASRNGASGIRSRGRIRGLRGGERNNTEEDENDEISEHETENLLDGQRGRADKLNGQDKLETGRDKTKSAKLLSKPFLRRGSIERSNISEDQVSDTAKSVQSEEDNEESELSITHDSSGNQRFFNRDGPFSSEDQKASTRNEAIIIKLPELSKPKYYFTKHKTKGRLSAIRRHQDSTDRSSTFEDKESKMAASNSSSGEKKIFDTDSLLSSEDQQASTSYEAVIMKPLKLHKPQISQHYLKKYTTNGRSPAVRRNQESIDQRSTFTDDVNDAAQSVLDNKESEVKVAPNSFTSGQKIFDKDNLLSSNQKARSRHEAVIIKLPELGKPQYYSTKHKTKGRVDRRHQEPIDRFSTFEDEVNDTTQSVQSEEDNNESKIDVEPDSSSDDQIYFEKHDLLPLEDQQASTKYEAVIIKPLELGKPQYYSSKHKTKERAPVDQRHQESIDQSSISEDEVNDTAHFAQSEDDKEHEDNATHNSFDDQQIIPKDGVFSSEYLKASQSRPEEVTHKLYNQDKPQYFSTSYSKTTRNKGLLPETVLTRGSIDRSSMSEGPNGSTVPSKEVSEESQVHQEVSVKLETVTHLTSRPTELNTFQNDTSENINTTTKGPLVVIFDGYSVTRHKNGENKLAEKAIRIRS